MDPILNIRSGRKGATTAEESNALREAVEGSQRFESLNAITTPQAICILDFYHAGEHISLLAEALYCTDATRVQAQAKIWREMLLEDKLHEVLNLRTALLSNRFDDLWLSRDLKAA